MPNSNPNFHIFSDKPTREDQLNFQDYAQILADIALNSETPTTIGIFGEWGSGKSSLMMMLDDLLKENNVRTIWFNAWKYDKEDALWRSLILRILDGLDAKAGNVEDIRRRLYTAISSEELGKIEINWLEAGKSLAKQGMKVAGTIAFPLAGIGNVIANIGKTVLNTKSIEDISKAVTRQTIERSQDRISSIEEFDKLYSELIVKMLGKNERLIVFIDDLDRCSPLQALLVLEALKSFLAAERCIYMVACDPRQIQKGFEKKYGVSSEQDVNDYLEKIVQIYFEIPPLRAEDTENFLAKLGIGDEAKAITQIVMSSLESNPRKLKRFLNNLEIQNQLVVSRNLGIEKNVLVKMACITYGWRNLWSQISENPSLLIEMQKYAVDKELESKVGVNPVVNEIFEKTIRIKSFLSQPPYFSEEDVDAYVFLARTTQADISSLSATSQTQEESSLKNPYIIGAPIRNEMFFNRESELRMAMEVLLQRSGSALSIFGQRKIGKTSFLHQLDRSLRNKGALPVYIDLQGFFGFVENQKRFLYLIAQSIARNSKSLLPLESTKTEMEPFEFDSFISSAIHVLQEKYIVLLFDEFEMIFQRIMEGKLEVETLDYLRSLVMKFDNFKMVFCSSKKLSEIAQEGKISSMMSPFYNIAINIKLSYFSRDAAAALISIPAQGLIEYQKDALEYFIDQTGGHPWLVQIVGYNVIDTMNSKDKLVVTVDDVRAAIDSNMSSFSIFEYLLTDPNPLEFAQTLARYLDKQRFTLDDVSHIQKMQSVARDEIQSKLFQLVDRDILIEIGGEDKIVQYKFAIPLFVDWLKFTALRIAEPE